MHRAAPFSTATRAYSAGGARSVVDKVDDKTLMQEMGGTHMKGETNDKIESPQNYGFTSVVMPADKDKDGNITEAAEAFISFMGGSRSFAVCQVMDDRRFRLKELESGDVAFFDHLQHQFHFNKDGGFLTGRTDKKLKFQLVEPPQDQQQQQQSSGGGGAAVAATAATSASGGSTGQQSGGKKKGQTARYKKEAKQYVEMDKDKTNIVHDKKITTKAPSHTFDGNVYITGELYVGGDIKGNKNLRINLEGYKPSDGSWETGSAGGPPGSVSSTAEAPLQTSGTGPITASDPPVNISGAAPLGTDVDPSSVVTGVVTDADLPMLLTVNNTVSLAYSDPLVTVSGRLALKLDSSLGINEDGALYVAGGGTGGGIPEAPSDGVSYGRRNAAWNPVVAHSGDIVDGGSF